MHGTSCVEADFSLINWTKDPNSTALTDFSLESILHCKQYHNMKQSTLYLSLLSSFWMSLSSSSSNMYFVLVMLVAVTVASHRSNNLLAIRNTAKRTANPLQRLRALLHSAPTSSAPYANVQALFSSLLPPRKSCVRRSFLFY